MAEETNAAFLLSLIGGVLILIGSFVILGLGILGAFGMGFTRSMMGHMFGMMEGFGMAGVLSGVLVSAVSVIGIASGIIVIYGAFSVKNKLEGRTTWGALILTFSLISLLSLGGFLVGAILGILGGILALVEK
jgi:hypothetical protein